MDSQLLPFSASLKNLPVYRPGRPIEEVARELGLPFEGIIKLASNENPLGSSPLAISAMREACNRVHLYPDGNGYYLKRELAKHLDVTPENVVLGNGSNDILELTGHALLHPDAAVVVSQYCFAVYVIVTRLFGAELIEVPALSYGHHLTAMLEAITPRTRLVFVANPNNPTGSRVPNKDLSRFIAAFPEDVLLVLDEAYVEFLEDPLDVLSLVRSGKKPNLLLTRTFSKIHGLAGLRIGYGVGHPEIVQVLEKIRQPFNVNAVAQAGAIGALEDFQHVLNTRANNAQGLLQLETAFTEAGLPFVPSSANFVLVRVGDATAVDAGLQRRGVIVRSMQGYGLPEWIRITVGTPSENQRLLTGLREVLQ